MKNKLLYKYKNGNVNVEIYEDGTKVREWPDDEAPRVEFPESCDLKVTQYCDMDKICVYCFTEDTKILLSDGTQKKISDVRILDSVVSFNKDTFDFSNNLVYNTFSREIDEDVYDVELENGEKFTVTGNHIVVTDQGEMRVDELHEDLKILCIIDNMHGD